MSGHIRERLRVMTRLGLTWSDVNRLPRPVYEHAVDMLLDDDERAKQHRK